MNFRTVLKSIGKALSWLPWNGIATTVAQLALVAGKVSVDSQKAKLTKIPSTLRGASSNPTVGEIMAFVEGQETRMQTIEQAVQGLQSYDTEQAKVVADLAEQVTTLADVMRTLSVRLNIFIMLAISALGISLVILILKLTH